MRTMLQIFKNLHNLNQVTLPASIPVMSNEMTCAEIDQQSLSLSTKLEGLGIPLLVHFCIFALFSYIF